MDAILKTTIAALPATLDPELYSGPYALQAAIRDRIEELKSAHPELDGFEGALVEVINQSQADQIEIYSETEVKDDGYLSSSQGVNILFMPQIGRAACNSYQGGNWLWTDAASPEQALQRYRDGDMRG